MPVAVLLERLFDDIADQQDLASAEKIGNNESCQSRYKYHRNAADDAGDAQWQYDF